MNYELINYVRVQLGAEPDFHALTTWYELTQQYGKIPHLAIFLDHLWDDGVNRYVDEIAHFVKLLSDRPGWKTYIVGNTNDRHSIDRLHATGVNDVLLLDFFLYRVYKEVIINHRNPVSTKNSLSSRSGKFLFLTGKLSKPHRIRLLKKLVDENLLEGNIWSLFYYDFHALKNATSNSLLPELTQQEFEDFVHKWKRNPDNANLAVTQGGYEYSGIPYDVNLYNNTDFSIISETYFRSEGLPTAFPKSSTARPPTTLYPGHPWLTEKTWIPILNRQPFIMAGDVGTLARLNEMGFETYEKWYEDPHLDKISDKEKRLDAIVRTVRHWQANNFLSEQHRVADFNAQIMYNLYYANFAKILEFMEKNELLSLDPDNIVPTQGRHDNHDPQAKQDRIFLTFYNNVKDPTWPNCNCEQDFFKLPEHIQQECITNFGYKPPENR
jgi:hypothetical protein